MFEDHSKKNKEYKNCENNSNKYNPAISFIEEDHAKQRKENFSRSDSNFKSANIINEMGGNNRVNMQNNEYVEKKNDDHYGSSQMV